MSDNNKNNIDEIEYGADSIEVLEGLEPVRKRPGMYIGSTSKKGLTHLVYEIVDNSVDEAMAGHGKRIEIIIEKDLTTSVKDYARGMPVGPHSKKTHPNGEPMDALEVILTTLHAGGKFGGGGYKVSGGLHGVGSSVTNALSESLIALVRRNGKLYQQKYEKGIPKTPVEVIGDANDTGTTIIFKPDKTIFDVMEYDMNEINKRFERLAVLNKGLMITLNDKKNNEYKEFCYEEGVVGYIPKMIGENEPLYGSPFYIHGVYKDDISNSDIEVEIAFQHDKKYSENIETFANNIFTENGGYHLTGFKNAFTSFINNYGKENKILKDNLSGDDIREGLNAIVSVKLENVQFEGQTKGKLGNAIARTAVETVFNSNIKLLEKNKSALEAILEKAIIAQKAREAARKQRELVRRKNEIGDFSLPGKLADCEKNAPYSELFIVEGDSAGGSAKQGRNKKFQAILALKGKPLNAERKSTEDILKNGEIKSMIAAFGAGIGKDFNYKKLRYDRVVIMTDADVDGSHIRTLLLTFFYNYMKPLLGEYDSEGREIRPTNIYIAQPPLYKVKYKNKEFYIKDDYELQEFKKKNKITEKTTNFEQQRFKGLGEMNPTQLWETTLNPETRSLKKVTAKDIEEILNCIEILMGKSASKRRDFIEANAHKANSDII